MDTERSPAARQRAEATLVALVHELGGFGSHLIVLGGLVPQLLARGQATPVPPHLGTTDVDLWVDFQDDVSLAPLEQALERLGFQPSPKADGWCWVGSVSGERVKVEFLCERDDKPANRTLRPADCEQLGVANLRGCGFVRGDCQVLRLSAALQGGETVTVEVRVAGLCGYLLAKACAARDRGLEKDYYDLAYVLLFNQLGGPVQAAKALTAGQWPEAVRSIRSVWRELADRFSAADRVGPRGYSAQYLMSVPDADEALLRQDAVAAVTEFIEELGVLARP